MSIKVIALGNVLMKDDGVAIEVARALEEKLLKKNIEVIYGETDIEYSISQVKEEDYIFILDAATYEKSVGEITCISLEDFVSHKKKGFQHSYSFLDLIKLYYPNVKGEIHGIEVEEVEFGLGLSCRLQGKLDYISKKILKDIERILAKKIVK